MDEEIIRLTEEILIIKNELLLIEKKIICYISKEKKEMYFEKKKILEFELLNRIEILKTTNVDLELNKYDISQHSKLKILLP